MVCPLPMRAALIASLFSPHPIHFPTHRLCLCRTLPLSIHWVPPSARFWAPPGPPSSPIQCTLPLFEAPPDNRCIHRCRGARSPRANPAARRLVPCLPNACIPNPARLPISSPVGCSVPLPSQPRPTTHEHSSNPQFRNAPCPAWLPRPPAMRRGGAGPPTTLACFLARLFCPSGAPPHGRWPRSLLPTPFGGYPAASPQCLPTFSPSPNDE